MPLIFHRGFWPELLNLLLPRSSLWEGANIWDRPWYLYVSQPQGKILHIPFRLFSETTRLLNSGFRSSSLIQTRVSCSPCSYARRQIARGQGQGRIPFCPRRTPAGPRSGLGSTERLLRLFPKPASPRHQGISPSLGSLHRRSGSVLCGALTPPRTAPGTVPFPKGWWVPMATQSCSVGKQRGQRGGQGKEDESQLSSPGMSRVNPRNRFIFRMVSQESLKQLARNLGY